MLGSLQVASLALTCAVWVSIPAIFVASRFSRSGYLRQSVPASFWAALETIMTGAVAGQDGQLQHWSRAAKVACDKTAIGLAAAGLTIVIAALVRQPPRSAHRRVRHHSAP